jgi:hypothetical protein
MKILQCFAFNDWRNDRQFSAQFEFLRFSSQASYHSGLWMNVISCAKSESFHSFGCYPILIIRAKLYPIEGDSKIFAWCSKLRNKNAEQNSDWIEIT